VKKPEATSKSSIRRQTLYVFGIIANLVLIVVITLLLVRVNALNRQITDLTVQVATSTERLDSLQRAYCTTTFDAIQANQVAIHHVTSAGYERSYRVHTPKNYDPSVRYPVVVSFDGMEGSGMRIEGYSGLDTLPVIAVYPDALVGKRGFTAWQGAPYALDGTRDIQFVKDLLDTLPSQYCVDSTSVVAVGMSNGGGFATLVGCSLSDKIRAVVSISGAYYTDCQQEGRTPSLMVVHSTADQQVPFLGSKLRKLPEVPSWVGQEAIDRNCKHMVEDTVIDGMVQRSWFDCKDDSLLRFVVLNQQDHGWLQIFNVDGTKKPDTTQAIWTFFQDVLKRSSSE
jgi:polyhydroxybutyrate depolymerase